MAYQNILENLVDSLPEIHGAFIYNVQQGVLNSKDRIVTNRLQKKTIGEAFSKAFFMMTVHYNDISSIRFNYKEMTLFGGKFHENDYLIVLCGSDISTGMTRIAVQMALNKLKESSASPLEAATPVVNQPAINPDELLRPDSSLSRPLIQIKQVLAKQVGPVADVLFEDALNNWAEQTTPTYDTLDELIQLLVAEIGDGGEGEEFKTEASKLF